VTGRFVWEASSAGVPPGPSGNNTGGTPAQLTAGQWKLVIEATLFVTYAVVPVWVGVKAGGNDPVGESTRVAGCDPLATVRVEPA